MEKIRDEIHFNGFLARDISYLYLFVGSIQSVTFANHGDERHDVGMLPLRDDRIR